MQFGRVQGYVRPADSPSSGELHLTVTLETGRNVTTVREETLPQLRPIAGPDDLVWHADQWTQETIGVDLALEGWEVVGAGPVPEIEADAPASSAVYAVRKL
jgi:hypothetical protein